MEPIVLPANTPRSFYRGAGRIHAFRGLDPPPDPYHPEDWVGSTTSRFGLAPAGLTRLETGDLLADLVREDPEPWLGEAHVQRHGADPGVLVKLLDAGQRLPLHLHPDRRFARSHLASPYGKTEAWVIVEAAHGATIHLGFNRDVEAGELRRWVDGQDMGAMLAATNQIPVAAGDAVVCPAGLPHAIGQGIFLVEVQEPTDFSILLEWEGFAIDGSVDGHLGLGFDLALECVDRRRWTDSALQELRGQPATGAGVRKLLPESADPFFTAERLDPDPVAVVPPGFSVVVVVEGEGRLSAAGGDLRVRRGDTLLVPFAAGAVELTGPVVAIRCGAAAV